MLVAVELSVGAAYVLFTVLALLRGLFPEAGFLAFVSVSYLWVGFGSLHVNAAPSAAPRPELAPTVANMAVNPVPKA